MKSTFKSFCKESRKTFLEREQIMTILGKAGNSQWLKTSDLVEVGNIFGWTTPLKDNKRQGHSHPYFKVISMMMDKNQPYYVKNLERRAKGNSYEYRLV